MRRAWTGIWLAALVAASGCGGGEMSVAEYAERFNDITEAAGQQYAEFAALPQGRVLVAEGEQLYDFAPQDLQVGLERIGQIESEILEAAAAIDPPEEVVEFHSLYFALSPYTAAREALAARAGTAADWAELSATPEMAAYRAAVAADQEACLDFIAMIDDRRERSVFGDTPWVPKELTEAIESVLGCDDYVENPEDLYRPPTATP